MLGWAKCDCWSCSVCFLRILHCIRKNILHLSARIFIPEAYCRIRVKLTGEHIYLSQPKFHLQLLTSCFVISNAALSFYCLGSNPTRKCFPKHLIDPIKWTVSESALSPASHFRQASTAIKENKYFFHGFTSLSFATWKLCHRHSYNWLLQAETQLQQEIRTLEYFRTRHLQRGCSLQRKLYHMAFTPKRRRVFPSRTLHHVSFEPQRVDAKALMTVAYTCYETFVSRTPAP